MKPNFSFRFELRDFELKIFFSSDRYIHGKCKIKLLDTVYGAVLYSYSLENIESGMGWYFIPPTSCVYSSSNFLTLIIENDKNEIIFTNEFQINEKINLTLLNKFPDILKFKNQNLYLPIVCQIFLFNLYEQFNLSIKKDDVVVDIGANLGVFSYFAFYKNPSKLYICEPNPNVFNILKNHFSNYKNIYLDKCAISAKNDFADFVLVNPELDNIDGERNHLNSYAENIEMLRHVSFETIKIQTKSFMEFVLSNQIHKIDFLKVDCEGGEYDIFTEDNAYYIKNNVDKIIVEYHNYPHQIVDFANKNNFSILNEIKNDINCDVLFLKNKNEPR